MIEIKRRTVQLKEIEIWWFEKFSAYPNVNRSKCSVLQKALCRDQGCDPHIPLIKIGSHLNRNQKQINTRLSQKDLWMWFLSIGVNPSVASKILPAVNRLIKVFSITYVLTFINKE